MKIALVSSVYLPLKSSGAVQMRDLAEELSRQGNLVYIFVPSPELEQDWKIELINDVNVVRLKALPTTGLGYFRRTMGEFLMPYIMLWKLKKTGLHNESWDAVAWYSPTIFLGPLVKALKRASGCRSYLIIRDIFPEWAVDMGLMGRGIPYWFFDVVARYQYSVADVIGVQTSGNLAYFKDWARPPEQKVEVLQNWLADVPVSSCSISVAETPLVERKIFVYAGNMGVAQGMDILLDLAERLNSRSDIGFLFVGRGSDAARLSKDATSRELNNVWFHNEIHPDEIPGLYAQCYVGLVALDPRHKTHNIPGKFLTYMQSGLPVLANINIGNDLAELIRQEEVGRVSEDGTLDTLEQLALELIDTLQNDTKMSTRCRALYLRLFSPKTAVRQIIAGLHTEESISP